MTFTYAETGETLHGDLPGGYRHVRRDAVIGQGEKAFRQVREGMLNWQIHLRAGPSSSEPGLSVCRTTSHCPSRTRQQIGIDVGHSFGQPVALTPASI